MLNKVRLGNSDLKISRLVIGGNVFGWTITRSESFRILDAFLDYGINCIDTADIYSYWANGNQGGESETIIGEWMKIRKNRDKIILATKVGKMINSNKNNLSSSHIDQAIHCSLRRLKTDYIDLYQAHCDDCSIPIYETIYTFDSLIKSGKVRVIGASNFDYKRLLKSLQISEKNNLSRYESIQPEFNLYDRKKFEWKLKDIACKHKLGVINYYPLAQGFFSGKYRTINDAYKSIRGKKIIENYLNERGLKILRAVDSISKKYGSTPAQTVLAWQIQNKNITAPIVSVTSLMQLNEIIKSLSLVLEKEDYILLDKISSEKL